MSKSPDLSECVRKPDATLNSAWADPDWEVDDIRGDFSGAIFSYSGSSQFKLQASMLLGLHGQVRGSQFGNQARPALKLDLPLQCGFGMKR